MKQVTTRLRKTFQYPTEHDDDSLPEGLDEQEQENLIHTLATSNSTTNAQYTLVLLGLSLLSTLLYIPTLLPPTTALPSLLSITSLLSTAYLLHALPSRSTGIAQLDRCVRSARVNHPPCAHAPLLRYLPVLNVALSGALAGLGTLLRMKRGGLAWSGFELVPGAVYAVVLAAKVVMGSVDPEGVLGALRYGYKGA